MLSDQRVRELLKQFVLVKIDPRDRSADRSAFEHKATRYVPEVVFLSPEGEVIDRLEDRSVGGTVEALESVLKGLRR